MCGRYKRKSSRRQIVEAFDLKEGLEAPCDAEEDISPGSLQPVVYSGDAGVRCMERMRWGFKMPDRLLFNARCEGIDRSSFWRGSFETRRCMIPADAFYEWEKLKQGRKYEFGVPGNNLFAMAGIWAPWKNLKTGEAERAFAILTTRANATMLPVHNRQPVILESGDYAEYLSQDVRPPTHLLRVLADDGLELKCIQPDGLRSVQTNLFESHSG
jgi:putative SOS response-associated peptidase YedK